MDYKTDKKIKSILVEKKQRGFVSLIALLLANVFLMIGMSVFAISLKELSLSFGGRESNIAFYAADGGMECALYWDIQQDVFATSTSPSGVINCAGHDDIAITYTPNGLEGTSSFEFSFGSDDSDPCVIVSVYKRSDMKTVIISRGRNNCNLSDSRRVERAWRVTY